MKLPDIEYGPVQESSSALARVDQATRQATHTVSAGLQALGQEMVKTQAQRAAADLSAGLAELEQEIAGNPYLSTGQIREQLGADFDSLPPAVRAQLTRKVADPGTGDVLEVDRDDVPTWLVAAALYEKRARALTKAAAQHIAAPGWQADFETSAAQDIASRKSKLALAQAHAMVEDQKATQKATLAQLVRGKAYDRALGTIESSRAFSPGEKAGLVEQVLAQKQKDEQETREEELLARADATARELEQAHPDDPQGAMKAAQALEGALGAKVAARLNERDRLRTEALNDEVRDRRGRLELGVRASQIRTVAELERLDDYKRLPPWAQADVVAIMGAVAEQRLRLSQLTSDKEWQQELSRYQGLSDREKVTAWPSYAAKVPLAYQGGFAQVYQAATMRLSNAWDTEDVQKTFDLAAGSLRWTGPQAWKTAKLKERGRRWYDAETRRKNGVPPTSAEAARWLAEALLLGDENGPAWGGGPQQFRFQAEEAAEKKGEPLRFEPYDPEKQKYSESARLLRGAPPAPAAPPPGAATVPSHAAVAAPRPGDRVPSEQLGYPPGGVFELQVNGRWKRVQ